MKGRFLEAASAIFYMYMSSTAVSANICELFDGSSVATICSSLVANKPAIGGQTFTELSDVFYDYKDPDAELTPIANGLCTSSRAGSIEGEELSQLLENLAENYRGDQVVLSRLVVMGEFEAPKVVPFSLEITDSIFCGLVDLSDAFFEGDLHLKRNLVIAGPNEVREGLILARNIKIAKAFELEGSRFGGLIAQRATVDQMLGITDAVFGHLTLDKAQLGDLALARSKQSKEIWARANGWFGDQVGTNNRYRGYPQKFFASNVDMWDALISGELYGDHFYAEGGLSANKLEVNLLRFHFADLRAADFRELRVQSIDFKGTLLGHPSNRAGCAIDIAQRYSTDFVSFSNASIQRSFELNTGVNDSMVRRTQARGHLCLNNMRIEDSLDLSGLDVAQLDLSGTHVGLNTILRSVSHGGIVFSPHDTSMDLTSFRTERLTLGLDSKLPPSLQMSAASIGFVHVLGEDDAASDVASHILSSLSLMADNDAKVAALRVFADTFVVNGPSESAKALEFERLRIQTDTLSWGAVRASRELAERLGGYGLRPERTLLVAAMLTLLGALVAFMSIEGRWFLFRQVLANPRLRRRRSRASRMNALRFWLCVDAISLSFDRLIPLITFSEAHKKLRFKQQPWVRAYFSLHVLFGLLLAATVVTLIGQSIGLRAP